MFFRRGEKQSREDEARVIHRFKVLYRRDKCDHVLGDRKRAVWGTGDGQREVLLAQCIRCYRCYTFARETVER